MTALICRTTAVALASGLILAFATGDAHATTKRTTALERALTTTAADDPLAVWVVFADKPVTPEMLREAEANLTPHARARRARNRAAGHLVDAYDLPVSSVYLQRVRATGASIRHTSRWLNAVSVDATPAQIHALAALPAVAQLDVVHTAIAPRPEPATAPSVRDTPDAATARLLDYGGSLSQNMIINTPAMHDLGYDGSGVWIAMLDTGFNNLTHPAFASLDVMITHDFVNGDSVVSDQAGQMGSGSHGALVLGSIAGYAPGNLIGPAFGATYLLAKTENTEWERHIEEDAWVAAAQWADSIGADIISSSLSYLDGFTHSEPNYTWQDMDGATAFVTIGADIAAGRGMLIVSAVGNNGFVAAPANSIGAPSDGDMVLGVGATDSGGALASFSSVGNAADGRTKPDVMAMGHNVVTISNIGTSYVAASGTSLSTPLVSGAAALVLQARPFASNVMLMNALRQTANNAGAPNRLVGWGVIDALAARNAIPTGVSDPPRPVQTSLVAYPNPFNPATTIEFETAAAGRVALVVYDAAGRRVATLLDEDRPAGRHMVRWNAAAHDGPLSSGVYLVTLTSGGASTSRKVVLLK